MTYDQAPIELRHLNPDGTADPYQEHPYRWATKEDAAHDYVRMFFFLLPPEKNVKPEDAS